MKTAAIMIRFRKTALALAAAVLLMLPAPAPAQTSEEIRSFAVDVSVGEDGLVRVIEHISYFFPAPKHGIYRYIPT